MRANPIDGVVLVDKAAGMTSHDVVAVARRALGTRRVGHAGTLDPFATGLLVLLVGHATRLLPYVDGEPKVYDATIRFGVETATGDPTGAIVREASMPDETRVADAITRLTGPVEQVPPAFSAKQVAGVRAYAAARRGKPLDLPAMTVVVHAWQIREWRGADLDVTIACGGGTYVRALARDLGALAGSAAHLVTLRRVRSGPFEVADAVSTDDLRAGNVSMRPPGAAVPGLPTVQLDDGDAARVAHGQSVRAAGPAPRVALVRGDGEMVAVADRSGDTWQPRVVLKPA